LTIWQPPTSPACYQCMLLSSTLDNCWLSFCRALNVTGNSRWNAGNALRLPDLHHQLKLPAGTAPPPTSLLSLLSNELPHQSLAWSPDESLWLRWTACVRGLRPGKRSKGRGRAPSGGVGGCNHCHMSVLHVPNACFVAPCTAFLIIPGLGCRRRWGLLRERCGKHTSPGHAL
jgi:hypothetical protein